MPSSHSWNLFCTSLAQEDAALLLQAAARPTQCATNYCAAHANIAKLPLPTRRGCGLKVLVCQETDNVDMYELGYHHSRGRTPVKTRITPSQRDFITELARENLMPLRIRHAIARKFSLPSSALPDLRTVQNIVHYYRRTRLVGNDKRKEILEAVQHSAFSGRDEEHNPFTFTKDYDGSGLPIFGNGSEARPFLVGMSTKALLRNAARDLGAFVLHLDATFKLNCVGYPVLVCGITDASRTFHLLALFVTSQLQEDHYAAARIALRRMYARVNGEEMAVKYVCGGADKAPYNAFRQVFADSTFDYIMCFYHVVTKRRERSRGLGAKLAVVAFRGLRSPLFSKCG